MLKLYNLRLDADGQKTHPLVRRAVKQVGVMSHDAKGNDMNLRAIRPLVMLLLAGLVGCSGNGPGQGESVKYLTVGQSAIQSHFGDKSIGFQFARDPIVDVKHRPHFLGTLETGGFEVAAIELVVSPVNNEQVSAVGLTVIAPPRGAGLIVKDFVNYITLPSLFGRFFVTDWEKFQEEYLNAFAQVLFSSSPSRDRISVTHNDLRFEFARLPDEKLIVLVTPQ